LNKIILILITLFGVTGVLNLLSSFGSSDVCPRGLLTYELACGDLNILSSLFNSLLFLALILLVKLVNIEVG